MTFRTGADCNNGFDSSDFNRVAFYIVQVGSRKLLLDCFSEVGLHSFVAGFLMAL